MRNRRLETVGFIATLLVVMCHADDILPAEGRSWAARYFGTYFTAGDTPNFFLLSGYFLALKFGTDDWWRRAVAKRLRTLALPYFLWAALMFILCLASSLVLNGRNAPILATFDEPLLGFPRILGLGLVGGPMSCGPLWYVKTLFVFVLVSPPFIAAAWRWRWSAPLLAIICALAYGWLQTVGAECLLFFHMGFSLPGFAAFLIGAMFALHPVKSQWAAHLWVAPLALTAWAVSAWATLALTEYGSRVAPFAQLVNIAVAVAALHAVSISFRIEVPAWLTGLTFFIYVTHTFVLHNVGAVLAGAGYWAVLIAALGACTVAGVVLRRLAPKVFSILTGGRG